MLAETLLHFANSVIVLSTNIFYIDKRDSRACVSSILGSILRSTTLRDCTERSRAAYVDKSLCKAGSEFTNLADTVTKATSLYLSQQCFSRFLANIDERPRGFPEPEDTLHDINMGHSV